MKWMIVSAALCAIFGLGATMPGDIDVFETYEEGCTRWQTRCDSCGRGTTDLQIVSTPSDIHEAHGVDVTFPCTVAGSGYKFFFNPIIWYKVLPDGSEIQINNGATVSEPWSATGRYSINPDVTQDHVPKVVLPLHIKQIELSDNGTYRCELRNQQSVINSVTHNLIIPSPMSDLVFTTNSSEEVTTHHGNHTLKKTMYEFEELKSSFVSCRAVGGNPMPHVKIFRGKTDITGDFETRVSETRSGDPGLEITNYEVEVVNADFRPAVDHHGEKLKCSAKIPHSPEYRRTVAGEMDVRYPPKFECEKEHYVELHTEKYVLDCKIAANPPVELDEVFWLVGEINATDITIGETKDGLTANATINVDKSIHLVLTIDVVNMTDYQTYNIRAKNVFGEHHFQIHLAEATTTTTTTTMKPTERPKYKVVKPPAATDRSSTIVLQHSLYTVVLLLVVNQLGFTKEVLGL